MNFSENHSRAKQMVDSWPSWKKNVSLTKHSVAASRSDSDANSKSQYRSTSTEGAVTTKHSK